MAEKKIVSLQRHKNDSGSPEAQLETLSNHIKMLQDHVSNNPKDFDAKRSLLKKVAKRRKILKYLKENHLETYTEVSEKTGLKC